MRGIAILLVVLYHYVGLSEYHGSSSMAYGLQRITSMGWTGVDLFFVLSGFLIGGILLDSKSQPAYFQSFYRRRAFRILPIYYAWIAIYFVVAFTPLVRWGAPVDIVRDKWSIVPVYGLFAQNIAWSRGPAYWTAWLSSLWSLAVEEQFYLVVPLLIRFLNRRALQVVLITSIFCSPLLRLLAFKYIVPFHPAAPYMIAPCRMDALAMGVLLALAWRNRDWKARVQAHLGWLYAIAGTLFLGLLYFAVSDPSPYHLRMSLWGYSCIDALFAALVLLAVAAWRGPWRWLCSRPFLVELGGISYCVYIIHPAILRLCRSLLPGSSTEIFTPSGFLAAVVAAATTWILAKISWRYLESPLINRARPRREKSGSVAAPSGLSCQAD